MLLWLVFPFHFLLFWSLVRIRRNLFSNVPTPFSCYLRALSSNHISIKTFMAFVTPWKRFSCEVINFAKIRDCRQILGNWKILFSCLAQNTFELANNIPRGCCHFPWRYEYSNYFQICAKLTFLILKSFLEKSSHDWTLHNLSEKNKNKAFRNSFLSFCQRRRTKTRRKELYNLIIVSDST